MPQNPYEPPAVAFDDSGPALRVLPDRPAAKYASIVVCGMPLIYYGYVVLFWLLTSAALGEWARPGINDPKDFLFGVPQVLGLVLLVLSIGVVPFVLYLGHRRNRMAMHVHAYGTCLILEIILLRRDIQHITTWVAD